MSLPDHLLDDPDVCLEHSRLLPCPECRIEQADTYADWAYDERNEQKEPS